MLFRSAVGDGLDYQKYEKNPVLDEKNLPQGASKFGFCDPKVWQNADGTYSCVFGNALADGISFFADGTVEMDVVKYDLR